MTSVIISDSRLDDSKYHLERKGETRGVVFHVASFSSSTLFTNFLNLSLGESFLRMAAHV